MQRRIQKKMHNKYRYDFLFLTASDTLVAVKIAKTVTEITAAAVAVALIVK